MHYNCATNKVLIYNPSKFNPQTTCFQFLDTGVQKEKQQKLRKDWHIYRTCNVHLILVLVNYKA